jgi:predicted NAD/FAD-binding protein
VFESARQLGGRARGVRHNDTQLDNGQHILLGCYRHTLRLIELVGGNIEQDSAPAAAAHAAQALS